MLQHGCCSQQDECDRLKSTEKRSERSDPGMWPMELVYGLAVDASNEQTGRREDGMEQSEGVGQIQDKDFKTERVEKVTDIPSPAQFRVGIVRKIRSLAERWQLPKPCLTPAGMLTRHELPLEVLAGCDLMGLSGRLQH